MSAENIDAARALATYPDIVKGYGHVKERNIEKALSERTRLRAGFRNVGQLSSLEAAIENELQHSN